MGKFSSRVLHHTICPGSDPFKNGLSEDVVLRKDPDEGSEGRGWGFLENDPRIRFCQNDGINYESWI